MQFVYLASLLMALSGLAVLDWRYKLAVWYDCKRTLKTLAVMSGIFVFWDLLGISLGIFLHGDSQYTLPVRLAPEFPIEELFFIVLLSYTTLLLIRTMERRWPDTSS